ncbi:MAG: HypC/HybG/HupF family hydrogenase formation chaperone [Hyphomicrobiaceae bacterium]|nr:HypC/HybG/HupF family hydrogenase formation chaperone [Hyphomicrobiaceae bacterium]
MCVGVPMQIVECGLGMAICDHNGVKKEINIMLVGEQELGTWVLVFIDAAREVIPASDALKINDALKALDIAMRGGTDIDHLFADLTGVGVVIEPDAIDPVSNVSNSSDTNSTDQDKELK